MGATKLNKEGQGKIMSVSIPTRKTARGTVYRVTWRYGFSAGGADGQGKREIVTCREKTDAESLRAAIILRRGYAKATDADVVDRSIVTGREAALPSRVPTFHEIATEYIATKEYAAPSSYVNNQRFLRIPCRIPVPVNGKEFPFADLPVDAISPTVVIAWRDRMSAAYAPTTSATHHIFVGAVFRYAIEMGYVDRTPVTGSAKAPDVRSASRRVREHEQKGISPEEVRIMLSVIPGSDAREGSAPHRRYLLTRDMVIFRLATGMRGSEVSALQIGSVDFDRGIIRVNRAHKSRRGGSIIGPPKNGKGREIPLTEEAAEIVRRRAAGRPADAFVFVSDRGGPVTTRAWGTRCWKPLMTAVRADGRIPMHDRALVPHSFRHAFGQWLLNGGVGIQEVSRWMGHSSISVTWDIYGGTLPGAEARAARALSGILGPVVTSGSDENPRDTISREPRHAA